MGGKTLSASPAMGERRRPAGSVRRPAEHSSAHESPRHKQSLGRLQCPNPGIQKHTRPAMHPNHGLFGSFIKTTQLLSACFLTFLTASARADGPGRIYTQPLTTDTGVITAKIIGAALTHAIAVEHDRKRVYLAALDPGGTGFRFSNIPVGRFDLVLVTRDQRVLEGLSLGPAAALPDDRRRHLEQGVAKADSFFNRRVGHRTGIAGDMALVFTERIRDEQILRGSGEDLNAGLRRLELIELQQADDEWQMLRTRHLYREETPRTKGIPFLTHQHLPALGGLRVAANPRDMGTLDLTPQPPKP